MYIHGYGSNGNATKGQMLRKMLPDHSVVSPTFDYDHATPFAILEQIRETIEKEDVRMIVGSSFGGYYALCATSIFHGPVWAINPVNDVEATIRRIILNDKPVSNAANSFLDLYKDFDNKVFQRQSQLNQSGCWPDDTPINFALSTDDELLGDHRPLLDLFPCHKQVVWKDHSGHHFLRFEELNLL